MIYICTEVPHLQRSAAHSFGSNPTLPCRLSRPTARPKHITAPFEGQLTRRRSTARETFGTAGSMNRTRLQLNLRKHHRRYPELLESFDARGTRLANTKGRQ